jgi:uncharacterized membrane protein
MMMPETTSNMTWIILGLLAAAVVIGVVLVAFPDLTKQITDFMGTMVTSAKTTVTDSLNAH